VKWGAVFVITVLVCLIVLYEWPKMNPRQRREKVVFTGFLAMGWILGVLLVFIPDLPSPTQFLDNLFKPLGKFLEK
jgi:multisubunit Na+/H+ antiporter MnhB subunit